MTSAAGLRPGRRVTVEAPATSANLGAGFDALALALDLVDAVTVEVLDRPGDELEVEGEGEGTLGAGAENRFLQGLDAGLRAVGVKERAVGVHVRMQNGIPLSRGLGSSAAAAVAGVVAATALTGSSLDAPQLLLLATTLEGHPDNAAAAVLGGFTVAAATDAGPVAVRLEPPPDLLAVLFVPERPLATAAMRAVLPDVVPRRDAVHNLGRAALAVAAIATGRVELLAPATEDRLHETYRAEVYPELPVLVGAARAAGALGACLSGAGSTVVAFARDAATADRVGLALATAAAGEDLAGDVLVVPPRAEGARVTGG